MIKLAQNSAAAVMALAIFAAVLFPVVNIPSAQASDHITMLILA